MGFLSLRCENVEWLLSVIWCNPESSSPPLQCQSWKSIVLEFSMFGASPMVAYKEDWFHVLYCSIIKNCIGLDASSDGRPVKKHPYQQMAIRSLLISKLTYIDLPTGSTDPFAKSKV